MSLSHQQFLLTVLEIQAVTSIPQNLHKTFVIEESVQEMETSSPDWPLPAPSNFFFLAPLILILTLLKLSFQKMILKIKIQL